MNNIVIDGSVMTLATPMRGRRASHMHEINSTIEVGTSNRPIRQVHEDSLPLSARNAPHIYSRQQRSAVTNEILLVVSAASQDWSY